MVFAVSALPGAVFAEHGSDDSTIPNSTTSGSGGTGSSSDSGDSSSASSASDDSGRTSGSGSATREKLKAAAEQLKEKSQETHTERLEAARLNLCTNRQKEITSIMTRSITRAQNQTTLFSSIAERVKAFYIKKGKTLATYDSLVAAVTAAKTQAAADLATVKADTFSCDSNDPKAQAAAFKADLKTLTQAIKDYRTAVKNLIVGVKSVQGDS